MSKVTALISFLLVLVTAPAWAQTSPATPPAGDAAATGGITDYWWIILLVVLAVVAIWYFSRSRNRV